MILGTPLALVRRVGSILHAHCINSCPRVWTAPMTDPQQAECERLVEHATSRDPTVKFMVEKLKEAGCRLPPGFIKVQNCSEEVGGGFMPDEGVVICANHLHSQEEVNHALVHELIHAYDHCRGGNLDWTNCDHHACSEVRAANLSGDCHFRQEIARGHFAIQGQHKICIRRRAELSVSMNPFCKGNKAHEAVNRVFEPCFKDTSPFDRIP